MKYFFTFLKFLIFCTLASSMAIVPPHNNGKGINPTPPANTLAQDLDEIARMIPTKPIKRLATRYLLNDEQFQHFVRIINSNAAHMIQMHFRSQPEVIDFINWVRNQIILSDGEFEYEESEEIISIFNRTPFESNIVFGWQGIVSEFLLYYPEEMIRNHIQLKIAQNRIFAQFIQRLQALKPVYDSVLALPVTQNLVAILQAAGIDTIALDIFIRNQFGWQNIRNISDSNNSTIVPVEISATIVPEIAVTANVAF